MAAAVAILTLAFFIITLRPDVGGTEDSPKFQFVGRVLGTSHSPGYPFYAMATYLFGWLPISTLAYRINLFSGVCGALACACIFMTARRIGVSRLLSFAAALAAATSYPVWSNSVTAEVYTLAALLSALSILMLIGFGQTGDTWRLYAGCAAWACGFGNHVTISGILPAAVVYGIWKDRRVLQPRIAITAAIIGVIGVLQYAFIAIRTIQGAPYLEARATTVLGVFNVIIAKDVEWARFYQAQSTVAAIEVPMLLNGIRVHMGTIAIAMVLLAIVNGVRRRNAEVLAIFGAAAGTLAFIANLWGDVVGFITPVCVHLWPLAALGLQEAVIAGHQAIGPSGWPDRRVLTVAGMTAMTLPLIQGIQLWPSIDALRQPGEGPGVRALYSHLPPKSAIVAENYWLARLVNYMHFSGEVQPDPNPRVLNENWLDVSNAVADGLKVFAFEGATQFLNAQGFDFERTAIARQPMLEWFKAQPKGTRFMAVAAGRALPFDWLPLERRAQRPMNYSALQWTLGDEPEFTQSDESVAITAPGFEGRTITLSANDTGSQIALGDDVLVALDRGLAVAAFTPKGAALGRWMFSVDEVPGIELPPIAYALRGLNDHCELLRPGQSADVTSLFDEGRAIIGLEGHGKGILTITGGQPSHTWRFWQSHGRGTSSVDTAKSQLVFEGYQATRPVFGVSMPPGALTATATLASDQIGAVRICRQTVPELPAAGGFEVDGEHDRLFGSGWHLAERAGTQHFRWSQRQSTLTWKMSRADRVRLLLHLRPAVAAGATLQASINGHALSSCVLKPAQWTDCEFALPADTLREGINQFSLAADTMSPPSDHPGDPRELAFVMQASRVRVGK